MKYLLILLLLSSCDRRVPMEPLLQEGGVTYRKRIIENHTYLEIDLGSGKSHTYSLTHAGSCPANHYCTCTNK